MNFRRFTKQLSIYAVLLLLAYLVFVWLAPANLVSDVFWLFVPFFYLIVLLSKYLIYLLGIRSGRRFNDVFLAVTVVRFIIYLLAIVSYAFLFPEDALTFVITFLVFYFAFTVFEVIYLYQDLKKP
ncbi:MAG: hypothetical protein ACLFN2_04440 [Bacteroidales bacterium]